MIKRFKHHLARRRELRWACQKVRFTLRVNRMTTVRLLDVSYDGIFVRMAFLVPRSQYIAGDKDVLTTEIKHALLREVAVETVVFPRKQMLVMITLSPWPNIGITSDEVTQSPGQPAFGPGAPDYTQRLERFMEKVAKELNCLPDFAAPDTDNEHILAKIRELKKGISCDN
jgi:hypothetical protein